MREARLTVGDAASPARGEAPNPCVMGCAHLFLGSLFVLGEGRGGTEGGRVESRLAVSAVLANFRASSEVDHRRRLVDALLHASQVLHDRARSSNAFRGSFASCLAVLLRRGEIFAVRLGDLQLHIVRKGQIRAVFSDPAPDAATLLGESSEPAVQTFEQERPLETGDRVVLSNPALLEALSEDEVGRVASSLMPPVAARRLIEAAERKLGNQPISVQIVQVGEATIVQATSQAPVPAVASDPARPMLGLPPRPPALAPSLGEPAPSGGSWRWMVALLVALGVAIYVVMRFFEPTDQAAWAERANGVALQSDDSAPAARKVTVWDRVSDRLGDSGQTLDPEEVRGWLDDDPATGERLLREARAMVAALSVPPQEQEEDVMVLGTNDSGPAPEEAEAASPEAGADESEDEPEEPAKPSEPAAAAEVAVPQAASVDGWDPQELPKHLRGFDRIFADPDQLSAAKNLNAYIRRRHSRADRIFLMLDRYIAKAPRERSLAVLSRIPEARPGPRTRRWARSHVRELLSNLGIE